MPLCKHMSGAASDRTGGVWIVGGIFVVVGIVALLALLMYARCGTRRQPLGDDASDEEDYLLVEECESDGTVSLDADLS